MATPAKPVPADAEKVAAPTTLPGGAKSGDSPAVAVPTGAPDSFPTPKGSIGRHGFDLKDGTSEPDDLFKFAQAKAPSLTKEFVAAVKLSDDDLRAIGNGEMPPPPMPGPILGADYYLTPAGATQVPVGTDMG